VSDNEINELLNRFCGADEEDAKSAFCELDNSCRPILIRRLLRTGTPLADAKDAAQHSFYGFWLSRPTFRNDGAVKWRRFIYLAASRYVIDRRRSEANHPSEPFTDFVVPPDEKTLVDLLQAAALSRRLSSCANQLFLGLDPNLPHDEHDRQLISAQLYYEDGESLQNILDVLQCSPTSGEPIGMHTLRTWLRDEGVLQYLAFQSLYYENGLLAAAMLCTDREIEQDRLDALTRDILARRPHELAVCDITWMQAGIAIWHYRHEKSAVQIVRLIEDAVSCGDAIDEWKVDICEVEVILQRVADRLPFRKRILRLLNQIRLRSNVDMRVPLKRNKVWQRLAFQYYYHDDIGPTAILERIDPAAREVPVSISADKVSIWTSGRQLQSSVLKYWRKLYEGDFDDG
jgi:DNA-directed RNA polymerase specialized sigma24 family protein